MAIEALARAKINLALHVTGRRSDGYHLLDSLVAFAALGDRISVVRASGLSLTISGPFASELSQTDNLVLKAARALHPTLGARITLEKNLPLASGIGGGSADAAATLHALSRLWSLPLPTPETVLALGADVPVCLTGQPARMQGIGDDVTRVHLPPAGLLLINPGVALSTATVFQAMAARSNPPLPDLPAFPSAQSLATWLIAQRNDLQTPALALAPVIGETLAALAQTPDALLTRMSGSGATCFALYPDAAAAQFAAAQLRAIHPNWWITATSLT